MSKYSIRDGKGRFAKVIAKQATTGIVAGRLYDWKGITVRAFGLVGNQRLVMAHKTLAGLVSDTDLTPITKTEVDTYLAKS